MSPTAIAAPTAALTLLLAPLALAGDLTPPPGAVQPTDRTTLNAQSITLPYTISQPGSYVLTSNLTGIAGDHGIIIDTDNVTLDLNGFALLGVPDSGNGVYADSHSNIRITNGAVRDWGANGIEITFATNSSCIVDHVRADANGNYGITANDGVISGCTANHNGGGIYLDVGSITGCTARANQGIGINLYNGSLADCTATDNILLGFFLNSGSATNCTATYNQSHGFLVGVSPNDKGGVTLTGSTAANNGSDGFRIEGASTVTGNTAHDNGADGFRITGAGARIDANTTTDNTALGIHAEAAGNLILRNTASNNGTNYAFLAGNASAQVINVAATASFVSTDPNANLEY